MPRQVKWSATRDYAGLMLLAGVGVVVVGYLAWDWYREWKTTRFWKGGWRMQVKHR
jgi:hypothetical protein